MNRRDFITLLGGAAAAWPVTARAQRVDALPTIGVLSPATPAADGPWWAIFAGRLRALGWIEGRTVAIEYRWAEGRDERFSDIAAEFVRLNVNVIVTGGTVAVQAAKRQTSIIPIVFDGVGDPVGVGLVASLSRPGGNVTGLSLQQTDTAGKRIELLREVVPSLRGLAILGNVGNGGAILDMQETEMRAHNLGLDPIALQIRRAEDITPAFDSLKGRAEALYIVVDPLVRTEVIRINTLALAARLPTMHAFTESVQAGGLMSYGPDRPEQFRRTAELVDKILRGTKPGDIPVEQPTKFDLAVNLTTAKALGLTVPPLMLARADEVIE
jgi:putative tryptophan/tyrosine transport system substrate-binding protein